MNIFWFFFINCCVICSCFLFVEILFCLFLVYCVFMVRVCVGKLIGFCFFLKVFCFLRIEMFFIDWNLWNLNFEWEFGFSFLFDVKRFFLVVSWFFFWLVVDCICFINLILRSRFFFCCWSCVNLFLLEVIVLWIVFIFCFLDKMFLLVGCLLINFLNFWKRIMVEVCDNKVIL